jgi:hypothetical protein
VNISFHAKYYSSIMATIGKKERKKEIKKGRKEEEEEEMNH